MGTGHAHFLPQIGQAGVVGFERQHGVRTVEHKREPNRAVVEHLRAPHLLGTQAQRLGHARQQRGLGIAAAAGGRGAEAVYRQGRMTASYVHFYFPSNPVAVAALFAPDRDAANAGDCIATVGAGLPAIGS